MSHYSCAADKDSAYDLQCKPHSYHYHNPFVKLASLALVGKIFASHVVQGNRRTGIVGELSARL